MTKRKFACQGMNWIRQEKRLAIYLRDGLACVYCERSITDHNVKLTLDHLEVYRDGGSNEASNLVTCCSYCNSIRGTVAVETFVIIPAMGVRSKSQAILRRIRLLTRQDLKPFLQEARAIMERRKEKPLKLVWVLRGGRNYRCLKCGWRPNAKLSTPVEKQIGNHKGYHRLGGSA
jgi:HNH endonuclease